MQKNFMIYAILIWTSSSDESIMAEQLCSKVFDLHTNLKY